MTAEIRKKVKSIEERMSSLEAAFNFNWRALGGPPLEFQHRFHPKRKWPMDFAHVETKIAIETQGGIYTNGAHVRPVGYEDDCEKYAAAHLLGWVVFQLTPNMVENPALIESIIAFIRERAERNQ